MTERERNAYGCRCNRTGWMASEDPDIWVCHACLQPSPAVVEGDVVRADTNLMRYGPHHNDVVDTSTLISGSDYAWIAEYKWTPEIVVGSESGRKARVWVHKDHYQSAS